MKYLKFNTLDIKNINVTKSKQYEFRSFIGALEKYFRMNVEKEIDLSRTEFFNAFGKFSW